MVGPEVDAANGQELARLVDAAVQRYFRQLRRRATPYAGAFFAVLLIVGAAVFVPSATPAEPGTTNAASGAGSVAGPGGTVTGPGGTVTGPGGTGTGPGSTVTGPGSTVTGPGSTVTGPGSTVTGPGGTVTGPRGTTPAGPTGVSRSGVTCRQGVRQVTWTSYGPLCVPRQDSNPGATAWGVTGKTITLAYRKTSDGSALCGGASCQDDYVADLRVMASYFNKQYETYGRQIKIVSYDGRGQWTQETSGGGQAQAVADAQQAHDLGAFAMANFGAQSTFWRATAQKHVILMGAYFADIKTFDSQAPYVYGSPLYPLADNWAKGFLATACARMVGKPAIFAGDAATKAKKRVFGMVNSSGEPAYEAAGNQIAGAGPGRCGLNVKVHATYTFDESQLATQATQIIAKMKAEGVTTIAFASDPIMPEFLTRAATQQNYYPEWIWTDPFTGFARLYDQKQASDSIKLSSFGPDRDPNKSEGYRIWKLASPNSEPKTGAVGANVLLWYCLNLFNAIQAAGPTLTPQTFLQGWESLPESNGSFGLWRYGAHSQAVAYDFTLSKWNSSVTNPSDGKAGNYLFCNGGKRYRYDQPQTLGTGQLQC
jgi:hypothetical protein